MGGAQTLVSKITNALLGHLHKLTFSDDGKLLLTQRDINWLVSHFNVLARNRADYQLKQRDEARISTKSKFRLLNMYRERTDAGDF